MIIGYVFQKHNLFPHLSIKENIVLILNKIKKCRAGSREHGRNHVEKGCAWKRRWIKSLPKFPEGRHRGPPSRGRWRQTRRLFFWMNRRRLLTDLTGEVLRVIQELKGSGKDFIFVTHELKFLKNFADYILFMDKGQIVEQGIAECLENPKTELLKKFVEGEI